MGSQFSETVRSFLAPIIHHLDDPEVSEIMVNSPDEIWVERKGKVEITDCKFESADALMSAVNNISQFVKRSINEETPTMDARLPDGSRIHAILPPCARKGICLDIRKFSKDALTVEKLIEFGSLNQKALEFLKACTFTKKNIIVSGGTGSGKTSLLNATSSLIPNNERIIVIEDSAELQLQQDHVLPLESKAADKKGKGEVSIRDLLRSTLRLRPDRIVIGEIRGGEALDFLQALNTGHGGSMGTIHANSPVDALSRLETLTLFAGVELPLKAIRSQVTSAIDIVVQTSRYHDGSRKISHISEVLPLGDDGNYSVEHIFKFNQTGIEPDGRILGSLKPAGVKPSFYKEIEMSGYELPENIFDTT
jgi:pilus assembly protein CpaF